MKRLVFPIGAAALLLFSFANDATAAERVALVVGNGASDHTSRLANPTNDAADIADKPRDVGFEVIVGKDLRRDAIYDKVKRFSAASERADVSLFYYSGHRMQMDGKNYLVPVDAALAHKLDVTQRMVALDDVMSQCVGEQTWCFWCLPEQPARGAPGEGDGYIQSRSGKPGTGESKFGGRRSPDRVRHRARWGGGGRQGAQLALHDGPPFCPLGDWGIRACPRMSST